MSLYTYDALKPIAKHLIKKAGDRITLVGSMRRRVKDGIKDIDFITHFPLIDIAASLKADVSITAASKILRYRYRDVPIEIYYVPKESWAFGLLHFIGNVTFNIKIRNHAKARGYKLNQYGLFDRETNRPIAHEFECEKDIFKFIDFEWVSHSKRNDEGWTHSSKSSREQHAQTRKKQ